MSKTTNKFSPEVRERAVRMVVISSPRRDHTGGTVGVTAADRIVKSC